MIVHSFQEEDLIRSLNTGISFIGANKNMKKKFILKFYGQTRPDSLIAGFITDTTGQH